MSTTTTLTIQYGPANDLAAELDDMLMTADDLDARAIADGTDWDSVVRITGADAAEACRLMGGRDGVIDRGQFVWTATCGSTRCDITLKHNTTI